MPNQSTFAQTLQPDPALQLDATYRMNQFDRRYIDNQNIAGQTFLSTLLLNGTIGTAPTLDGGSANVVPGDVVCSASTNPNTVTKAVAGSALSNAGQIFGVVLVAAAAGAKVMVARTGSVGPSVTGLASGVPGQVRLNTATGRCQQVGTLGSSDYPIGYVDNVGNLSLQPISTGVAGSGAFPGRTPIYVVGTPDGATDNLPAYNSAKANAVNGDTIVFPAIGSGVATYFMNGTMTIPPGVTVRGAGMGLNAGVVLKFPASNGAGVNFSAGAGQENADACLQDIHVTSTKIALTAWPANSSAVSLNTLTTLGPASYTDASTGQTVGDRRWYAKCTTAGNRGTTDPFHPVRGGGQGSVQGWVSGQTVTDGGVTWTIQLHCGIYHTTRAHCARVSVTGFTNAGFFNQGAIGGPDLTQPTEGSSWVECYSYQNGLGYALIGDRCGTATFSCRAVGTHSAGVEEMGLWDMAYHGNDHFRMNVDLTSGMSHFANGEGWRGAIYSPFNSSNTLGPYVIFPGLIVGGRLDAAPVTTESSGWIQDGSGNMRGLIVLYPVTVISNTNYSSAAFDELISVLCSTSAVQITLPLTPNDGYKLRVQDTGGNAATHNITVVRQGSNTIRGGTSFVHNVNFGGGIYTYSATRNNWDLQVTT